MNVRPPAEPERGSERLPRWLRWLVLVLLAGVAAIYLRQRGQGLLARLDLRPGYLPVLAAVELGLLVLRGLLTRDLCARFDVRLGRLESAGLAAWTSFANYVTPLVGGSGFRAVYLKRRHRLPYASFLSVQMATYSLHFMVSAAVGLVCLPLLPGSSGLGRRLLAGGLGAIFLGCLLAHRWPFPSPRGNGIFARQLRRVLAGWQRIHGAGGFSLAVLLGINALTQALAIWLGFAALGVTISWLQALFVAAIYAFSILIAITPAALGISEGAVVFAATAAGLEGPVALAAAALRRVVSFAATAAAAAASTFAAPAAGADRP